MRKKITFAVLLLLPFFNLFLKAQSGEELFKSTCASCHTINKGRLVGPDLTRVYEKRSNDWLISFIRSSQKMIKAGDPDANAVFNEYNKIPMPDNNFTDEQIISIIDYIKAADGATGAPPGPTSPEPVADSLKGGVSDTSVVQAEPDSTIAAAPAVAQQADTTFNPADTTAFTSEIAAHGRALFNGNAAYVNNGAPCLSCHNIRDQSIFGGGRLAMDLTFSYTKLGPAGISAILSNPPFPAMRTAMQNYPLTPEEIQALIALLKNVDERNSTYHIIQAGGVLFGVIGFVCALFIMVHLYVFYDNRKISDSNKHIIKRK